MRSRVERVALVLALCLGCSAAPASAQSTAAESSLRVCADPNNMPFSNAAREGFENKLAEMIAQRLGMDVSYTWWAQRRGFIRHTLKAKDCDLVIGVPAHYDLVETTRPYYRSSYVFVTRADRALDISTLQDPRLKTLKIGVHLIGDDGNNTPPAHALGQQGLIDNVFGYMIYGDYREPNPPARLIDAVTAGQIDIAAAWGPLAGYAARQSSVPLRLTTIEDGERFAPLRFQFDIAMGVRKGDHALKQKLNAFIDQNRAEIDALLTSYGVPLVAKGAATAATEQ